MALQSFIVLATKYCTH